ncbi:DNA replication/repair protein RecF [Polycyclovorans algicola]|uniref:DNA replication/repair protein RecF n=1 Tax=Polycyclovorans algicola TaxID=616992 RepID=UPI0004A777B8|nr:DNA replication and repair protein RecF [Polycyclovorans algicola]
MAVRQLRLVGYRALKDQTIHFGPSLNFIIGENASGKTSLLEALDISSRGRSFRTQQLAEIACWQGDGRWALDLYQDGSVDQSPLKLRFVDGRLGAKRLDEASSREQMARSLPALILGPDLHRLTEDGPKIRRAFLDWALFHVEHPFAQHWRRYQQALRQRNAAIRRYARKAEIVAWNDTLLSAGAVINRCRHQLVDGLKIHFAKAVGELALLPDVELAYRQGWAKDVTFEAALAKADGRHEILTTTPVGPHRSDLELLAGPGRAQAVLSRGQQKVFLISLALALARTIHEKRGIWPLLAIDDWHAELSDQTAGMILNQLAEYPGQRVLSGFAPPAQPQQGAAMFHVEQGRFREC